MSNGEVCCILGVCCPPGSLDQQMALAHEIQKHRPHLDEDKALKAADRILRKHDNFADIAQLIDDEHAA